MSNYHDIQEECYEANLLLPKRGLADFTFGNVSVLDRARGVFAIKPSGVDYARLKPGDMPLIDLEGHPIGTSKLRPSSDTPTHRRLYLAFPTIGSVVHTHSRHAVSFAQAGRPIPCLGTTHGDYFHGEVPVTRPLTAEEIGAAYEWETGNVIAESFATLNPEEVCAVLVCSHGPFTWGATASQAIENAQALEIIAQMAFQTLLLNPAAEPIQRPLLDKHFLRKHGVNAYYGQK